jgi:hypothetical protein
MEFDESNLEEIRESCNKLCLKLLHLLGEGLGVSFLNLRPIYLSIHDQLTQPDWELLLVGARNCRYRRVRQHPPPPPLPSPRYNLSLRSRRPRRRPLRLRLHHPPLPPQGPSRLRSPAPRRLMGTRPRVSTRHRRGPQSAHPHQHWRHALLLDQRTLPQHCPPCGFRK